MIPHPQLPTFLFFYFSITNKIIKKESGGINQFKAPEKERKRKPHILLLDEGRKVVVAFSEDEIFFWIEHKLQNNTRIGGESLLRAKSIAQKELSILAYPIGWYFSSLRVNFSFSFKENSFWFASLWFSFRFDLNSLC